MDLINLSLREKVIILEQEFYCFMPDEWVLRYRMKRRNLGICRYRQKDIILNLNLLDDKEYDFNKCLQVFYHEVSHALSYPNCGHCSYDFGKYCNYFGVSKSPIIKFNSHSCNRLNEK